MSFYRFLSLVAFLAALLAGGGLVALAGKDRPTAPAAAGSAAQVDFVAELVADTLGVRPVETEARGRVEFTLVEGGGGLAYRIEVSDLEDAFMSHLHLGTAEDRYGSLVVWLWPDDGRRREVLEGRFSGILQEGVIRAENLTGALAHKELTDLLTAIRAGRIFADIHTRRNVPGELRGQVLIPSP
ncbi:CHRD domain-containing protein [Desulfurivibrio sp. D14AmB]|uniref:CHRD domain-containing protein n=1 Tax=Desulfurivibrio sp. D14AmB TaxID=3374370 RepID=UPI00376EB49C